MASEPEVGVLPRGSVLSGSSGLRYRIEEVLGTGGQGGVYRVAADGEEYAVKWYHPAQATRRQRTAIEWLIRQGTPSPRFVWPLDIVERTDGPGFGYAMILRPAGFHSLTDLMGRVVSTDFRTLTTVGANLAHGFLQLHLKGLCYRDISPNNVFFSPASGDVLIIDNDNVAQQGDRESAVEGTPEFIAPEIVRGQAVPSRSTDLFSLSVLLFITMFFHHPLKGRRMLKIHCYDKEAVRQLCGTAPLFVFDKGDDSNQAVAYDVDPTGDAGGNAVIFWRVYPALLRNLFLRAFGEGLKPSENGRVQESEWCEGLVRLRDSLTYCPSHHEMFTDNVTLSAGPSPRCWNCGKPPPAGKVLILHHKTGPHRVVLNTDTRLYSYHLSSGTPFDFSRPLAEVTQKPGSGRFGLRNLSERDWRVRVSGSAATSVRPGRTVGLELGLQLEFGEIDGEVATFGI
jgi:eukaryotic-like serine/threonine-protein kinase